MEIIQISEEQAREMLGNVTTFIQSTNALCLDINANIMIDKTIQQWKEKGYIKKSKLEEARDYTKLLLDSPRSNYIVNHDIINGIKDKYEQAIEEILENK